MSRHLLRIADALSVLLHGIGIYASIPVLTLIIFCDVFLRYVFNKPLRWGDELSSLLLLVVLVGSLNLCTQQRGHVRMDSLYTRFGARLQRGVDTVTNLCGILFAAFLTYQSVVTALENYRWNQGAEMINIPYWPLSLFMAGCGLLLALRFLFELLGISAVIAPTEDTQI
jgi:TRAP-type C4-dicarboxylate transport system permease small subunit